MVWYKKLKELSKEDKAKLREIGLRVASNDKAVAMLTAVQCKKLGIYIG